jgi:hypothetical protein
MRLGVCIPNGGFTQQGQLPLKRLHVAAAHGLIGDDGMLSDSLFVRPVECVTYDSRMYDPCKPNPS